MQILRNTSGGTQTPVPAGKIAIVTYAADTNVSAKPGMLIPAGENIPSYTHCILVNAG